MRTLYDPVIIINITRLLIQIGLILKKALQRDKPHLELINYVF